MEGAIVAVERAMRRDDGWAYVVNGRVMHVEDTRARMNASSPVSINPEQR
jgi:hypothetical protein